MPLDGRRLTAGPPQSSEVSAMRSRLLVDPQQRHLLITGQFDCTLSVVSLESPTAKPINVSHHGKRRFGKGDGGQPAKAVQLSLDMSLPSR